MTRGVMAWAARATTNCLANPDNLAEWKNRYLVWQLLGAFLSMGFNSKTTFAITVRIAHLRIAHWGAILRWAILTPLVIRIAHLNIMFCMFVYA